MKFLLHYARTYKIISIKHANIKKILDPWESDRPITKKTIEAITEIELKILEML